MTNAFVRCEARDGTTEQDSSVRSALKWLFKASEERQLQPFAMDDEQFGGARNKLTRMDLHIVGEGAYEEITEKLRESAEARDPNVAIMVFEDAELDSSAEVSAADLIVSYYRLDRPDNQFVVHRDSNVCLVHGPTGITVRCTRSRQREKNYAIALRFLKCLVRAG